MKPETNTLRIEFRQLLALMALGLFGCSAPKKVTFPESVDTNDKIISYQMKKTYEIEKMDVWVSNEFDAARVNGLEQINDSTIALSIEPENLPINKSPYFAFRTWAKESKTVYFRFTYPKGFKHRYNPKINKDGAWQIVDSVNLIKEDSITTLKIAVGQEPLLVAAQEINSTAHVRNWYQDQIVGTNNFVRLKSAGNSGLGRNLPVLDIYNGDAKGKDIIVLLTRQHPPEVTGYFAFQSFLKTIVAKTDLSTAFLNKYRVLAFPILNPDGVDLGHWRHNSHGVDTNRDWSLYKQPEVRNVVSFITKTAKKDRGRIVLGLDFHSTYEDVFYTNKKRKGTTLPNFVEDWFALLEQKIPGYKVNEAAGNSTKPVSKGWFLYGKNATGITYEIGDETPKDRIQEIGTNSANAMMELLLKASEK
ncbi:M14 family metallopeptidase [Spongiimicrobium sp. 3-5]|uniref:M14 family metallopeptidase n=1 Tax=Spongiimicrobium sp. 3-5 TaxID=3332596 RepID=UPI0039815BDA